MDNKETARIFTPKIKTIILYLFLFIGIIIILREYIGGRSLWVDEAMLALNMPRSFKELLQPLAYNQTAPLLFLYLCKFSTILFRISDYSLRVVPLLFGLGSYIVYFFISNKILNNFTSIIISLALYLSSYNFIYYSNEFKPYSADVLIPSQDYDPKNTDKIFLNKSFALSESLINFDEIVNNSNINGFTFDKNINFIIISSKDESLKDLQFPINFKKSKYYLIKFKIKKISNSISSNKKSADKNIHFDFYGKNYKTDGVIKGIYIPKGIHEIKFLFMLTSFITGLIISSLTFILLIALLVVLKKLNK